MGAGTNVQDRLIALHDLDCPWRPRDLTQRKGRIERQGNRNKKIHVFRYVTEGTFDAYLWQTVEKKQQFIGQIMTSRSPLRSYAQGDDDALSYAEIKALCAGDPRIKERMELDVEVSKLKLMKADYQNKHYRMEDNLLRYYPEQIQAGRSLIKALEADCDTLNRHPHPKDGFAGMTVGQWVYQDREPAGEAVLALLGAAKGPELVEIGAYRGFTLYLHQNGFQMEAVLKGAASHRVELGQDARGNVKRMDNALAQIPQRVRDTEARIADLQQQCKAAKAELDKPFPQEAELAEKSARLAALDAQLKLEENSDTTAA